MANMVNGTGKLVTNGAEKTEALCIFAPSLSEEKRLREMGLLSLKRRLRENLIPVYSILIR